MQSDLIKYVEGLKRGDVQAFRSIFDLYQSTVYGLSKKLTGDVFSAEEITSQVFVTLWKRRASLDTAFPIYGIIFKITKDLIANYFTKVVRDQSNLNTYLTENRQSYMYDGESNVIFQLYLDIADEAILLLPVKRQEIFKLYFYQSQSYTQIANELNIEESTVRVHIFKALEFIRKYILSHPDFG